MAVEIEDRGMTFKSWKSYAKFLEIEVKKLQQLLPTDQVASAFEGAKAEIGKEAEAILKEANHGS